MRGIRARSDGLLMDLDSRSWIDWNLLFRGDYEPHLTALWNRLAPQGGVAIDIGANIGAHTLSLARAVGPGGRVLAFEPNPPVRAAMLHNLSLNGIANVTLFDCALGSAPGTLPLRVPKSTSAEFSNIAIASLVALDTPHDLVNVEVRTLDDVLASVDPGRVDAIKIDVNGYEVTTLNGMRACLERYRPAVVFEYDGWAWEQAHAQPAEAIELFQSFGYEVHTIADHAKPGATPLSRESQLPGFLDLIARHPAGPRRA
ncbi:MAG TPA: FkbM family methyltransferase [Vicinamibacterales bacterium]|nr:FkbM family methyltransferase [Vicinamibacterales bacterium]